MSPGNTCALFRVDATQHDHMRGLMLFAEGL